MKNLNVLNWTIHYKETFYKQNILADLLYIDSSYLSIFDLISTVMVDSPLIFLT